MLADGRPAGSRVRHVGSAAGDQAASRAPEECSPIDPQGADGRLRCPTHGLEKFDQMVGLGWLKVAYQDGPAAVYEVVR